MENTIQDTYFLENVEQLRSIAEPVRWQMLSLLIARPLTGAQLARLLKIPRARAHYHLKNLENSGLVHLVEERRRQHMIEHYYRAIAYNFRTDKVLALDAHSNDDDAQAAGGALPGLIGSMLSLVQTDMSNPTVQAKLARLNYNIQGDLLLTYDQFEQMRFSLRKLVEQFRAFETLNAAGADNADLLPFRYTLLLTPTESIDISNGDDDQTHD